jgi:hypothetical protein
MNYRLCTAFTNTLNHARKNKSWDLAKAKSSGQVRIRSNAAGGF